MLESGEGCGENQTMKGTKGHSGKEVTRYANERALPQDSAAAPGFSKAPPPSERHPHQSSAYLLRYFKLAFTLQPPPGLFSKQPPIRKFFPEGPVFKSVHDRVTQLCLMGNMTRAEQAEASDLSF